MRIKHLQKIADLRDDKNNLIRDVMSNTIFKKYILKQLHAQNETLDEIINERNALDYLIGCQMGITYENHDIEKPDKQIFIHCFEKELLRRQEILASKEIVKGIHKYSKPVIVMCKDYIEKFNDDIWYGELPDKILTYAHKYSNA